MVEAAIAGRAALDLPATGESSESPSGTASDFRGERVPGL
jgi:hypothetical protein